MHGRLVNLPPPGSDLLLTGLVEDGEVVVRAAPAHSRERGIEVYRFGWTHHLHATPVHESVLALIADMAASAIRQARDRGYEQAREDIRRALGAAGA